MATSDWVPGPMPVDCPRCEAHVIGEPHGFIITSDPRDGLPARWTLLKCEKKGHPLLVVQEELASGMKFEEDTPHRVYPPQDRRLSRLIPSELRSAHEEARKCYQAKAYRAAIVMCGITLEGACQLEGAKKANLQEMLEEMRTEGKIDNRLWEWAESLRHVRNSASHFNDEALTRQDADDSLAFSEALLDYLFVLTIRFEEMKLRRAADKQVNGH